MAESEKDYPVLELQERWDRIRIANLYDALDQMGFADQCLDLAIKPLFPNQHLAGKAIPCRGGPEPRTHEEMQGALGYVELSELVYPGSVVVVGGPGAPWAGKFGEMTSWNLKQAGAKGLVIDGLIRDRLGLEMIPDYTVCARGTSAVESYGRWWIHETNCPINMPGTSSYYVRVNPGDWVVGGPDGVIVVPQEIAMEILVKVEEIERREQRMREDLAAGVSFAEAYKKYGRA